MFAFACVRLFLLWSGEGPLLLALGEVRDQGALLLALVCVTLLLLWGDAGPLVLALACVMLPLLWGGEGPLLLGLASGCLRCGEVRDHSCFRLLASICCC